MSCVASWTRGMMIGGGGFAFTAGIGLKPRAAAKSSGAAGFGRLAFDSVPVLAAAAYASVHGNDMMSFSRLVSRGPPVSI